MCSDILFDANQPLPSTTYSVREDSTIFSLVEQGLGVSVVPELAFRDLPDSVARVPLAEPLVRTIGVAILPGSLKIPAVRAFLGVLKEQFPDALPDLKLPLPAPLSALPEDVSSA